MVKGKLKNGFDFKTDERVLGDWRFVKLIADTEKGDMATKVVSTAKLVEMVLGEEGENNLVEYIANKNDGFVPQEEMYTAVIEIIETMKEKIEKSKKSLPSPE